LIRQTLTLRRRRPDLFAGSARYEAMFAQGAKARHVVAFMRGGSSITVVPRLVLGLKDDWGDTTLSLPHGPWRDELTGQTAEGGQVPVAALLSRFPVALVTRVEEQ
jgi:(1->4)-alpha-D-glucan 1-alpha-D-glucosylmutase